MKSKGWFILALVLILLLSLLAACKAEPAPTPSPTPPAPAPTPAPTPTPPTQEKVIYLCFDPGTAYYTVASSQTPLLNKYTDLNVICQPLPGTVAEALVIEKGDADVCIGTAGSRYDARYSLGMFGDAGVQIPHTRLLMLGHTLKFSFMVHPDSGIKKVEDLRGRKVDIIRLDQPFNTDVAKFLLKAYGIDPDQGVEATTTSSAKEQLENFIERRSEVFFTTVTGSKMPQMEATCGVLVLPLDPNKFGLAREKYLDLIPAVLPAGEIGAPVDTTCIARPSCIYSNKYLSDDIAYKIVKALCEHGEELYVVHADLKEWKADTAVGDVGVPYHPGAIKYYQEAGLWTKEMDEKQAQLLEEEKTLPVKIPK